MFHILFATNSASLSKLDFRYILLNLFFFFFFYQKKNKKLSSKRPPPVLKRTSLTSSRVFVRVSNRKREREGEGKRGCSAKNEEAKQTAARKRMNE